MFGTKSIGRGAQSNLQHLGIDTNVRCSISLTSGAMLILQAQIISSSVLSSSSVAKLHATKEEVVPSPNNIALPLQRAAG
jgi:hypothetical protein